MSVKICYLSVFVLIYDWIGFHINAEKTLSLDPALGLFDEDTDLRLEQKRFLQRAMDPLMRRSPLDKNFMRFGKRSDFKLNRKLNTNENSRGDSHTDHDLEDILSITSNTRYFPEDNTMPKRVKQDFIRFGRGKQDFIRFGRGKQDFIRFGRGNNQGYIRLGRADLNQLLSSNGEYHKPRPETELHEPIDLSLYLGEDEKGDSWKNDDDKKNDTKRKTIPNNSFLRLGRADNFIRFGRNLEIGTPADNINYRSKRSDEEMRYSQDGTSLPTLFVADLNPVEFRRSSGFMRLGRGESDGSDLPQVKDIDRRKRSVYEVEPTQPPTVDIKAPKIGFKGIVVLPTGTAETSKEKPDNSESNTEKNELSELSSTDAPEINFHIPSVRHKREAYEYAKLPSRILKDDTTFDSPGEATLGSSEFDSIADSPEYYFLPVIKSKPNPSKDYLVRIG